MPIIGIQASSFRPVTGDYEAIFSYYVDSPQTSIVFNTIPSTYKHLQLRASSRHTAGTGFENLAYVRFNGDTGNNYSHHFIYASDTARGATGQGSIPYIPALMTTNLNALADTYGGTVLEIPDYTNTNKNKSVSGIGGSSANGDGAVFYLSGAWYNTNVINSITLVPEKTSFAINSVYSLYGLKG